MFYKFIFTRIKCLLFLGILLSSQPCLSQVRLVELLKDSYNSEKDLIIENQEVYFDSEDNFDSDILKTFPKDESGKILVPFKVEFINCTFPEYLLLENFNFQGMLMFYECTFEKTLGIWSSKVESIISWNSKYTEIYIEDLECNRFILNGDVVENWIELINNQFIKELDINAKANAFDLIGCEFETPKPKVTLKHDSLFHDINPTLVAVVKIEATDIDISENKFVSSSDFDLLTFELSEANFISISRNEFGGTLSLSGNSDFINIFQNQFNRIEYHDFSFPEFESSIAWADIAGNKISGMFNTGLPENWVPMADSAAFYDQMNFQDWEAGWVPTFYFGQTDQELRYKWFYDELFADYYRMYLLFKAKGKIDDANNIYVEMKELYGRRLNIIYKDNRTLKNFLNWQLNRLLKLYTEHGTDPAKAILISIYILLIFSGFYFFFPSEWDEFEFKKEKWKNNGVLRSMKVILIHAGNSITLSLNSFVTLGFGRIPTTGFARYICILEGFIGWFLLSIFTVSLITNYYFKD